MLISKNYFFNRKYLCWISCIRRVRKIFCKLIFRKFSLQGFACKIWRESTEIMYENLEKISWISVYTKVFTKEALQQEHAIPVGFLQSGGIKTMVKRWLKSHLSEKSAFHQYSWTIAEKVHVHSWSGIFGRVIGGISIPGIEYRNQVWNRIGHVPSSLNLK